MKRHRKWIALILTAALALSVLAGCGSSGAAAPMENAPAAQLQAQPLAATADVPTFADVPVNAWCAEAVTWAVSEGITNGTGGGNFSPERICTHGEILTLIDRAVASEQVNDPTSNTTPCTRRDTVTYLWQAAGSPASTAGQTFSDVPADTDYAPAVAWAVENGVTNGTSATTFSPDNTCTRAQIVTFLYRAKELLVPQNTAAGGSITTNGGLVVELSELEHQSANGSTVYYTDQITPEAMMAIYEALNWTPTGKVR